MSKTRVLLADDHALVRTGIRNALQEMPNLDIVCEAWDGPTLHAGLEATHPDLLLVDVSMPSFEPLSTIRKIRAEYPELRILVISAYDDDIYVQGLLGEGVNGYHLKDQPLGDLKLAVARVLQGERWISSPLVGKLVNFSHSPAPVTLSARQRDILRLLQQGMDNNSIARSLGLSVKTIENHLTRLYRQLGVRSRLEAVNYAMENPEVMGVAGHQAVHVTPWTNSTTAPEAFSLLLVDDNARYRAQLRRMIGRVYPQIMIYEAENIAETVLLVEKLHPNLALVDVVLGDEDGIRCTRRLKALCPTTRVVLISAYPDREFHRMGLAAGAIAFLDKKDLDLVALRQIIDDVLT